jgi:dipeptidyl aminopeptidase/acylaminoacyl peptidase
MCAHRLDFAAPHHRQPLQDFSPAWSPEGASIAFLRKPADSGLAALFLVPPTGGPERRVGDISLARVDTPPALAWTPDGKWLIAPSRETAHDPVGLFLLSPADGTRLRLTRPPPDQSDLAPAIAPNGRMMAFTRSTSESVYSIYLLPLSPNFTAAGEPQSLPSFPNLRVGTPQWPRRQGAPVRGESQGRHGHLAHARAGDRRSRPTAPPRNICRPQLPHPHWPALRGGASGETNSGARISPDGRRIALDSRAEGRPHVYVIPSAGGRPERITEALAENYLPTCRTSDAGFTSARRDPAPSRCGASPTEEARPNR